MQIRNFKHNMAFLIVLLIAQSIFAQGTKKDSVEARPARPAFESSFIINNPSNVLFPKNTMEIQIKHRFGIINTGGNDLFGIWAPSNIRLGVTYAVSDRFTIGFGTTRFNRLQDFSLKGAILNQTRSNSMPVSVSYYGNFTIDARPKENFASDQDRFSFFNQLIIARRFGPNLSLQLAPSVSHFNMVDENLRNDKIALGIGGRYKLSLQTAILFDINAPFTHHLNGAKFDSDPETGLALGIEFATAGHAFQIFIGNYSGIVPQQDSMYNQNDFFKGDILLGFNITRAYRF
ncbi:DUF5777 family beta-barrel protein [Allomuricauda sp. NBRC 101325]|uniref:DUF5777 family beta-barrel protein n=1 Tax=Allomuricauda sp. NBRC 101325 TaxID=1113758 RepID=UPI0024A2C0B3|nr:DUF5777 family beta-barrel protein [Muricauda sp. NBRC 101325]GLU44889.1 hypothetical protein Musp01_25130 [Muricauda sp. NBRC 101325]